MKSRNKPAGITVWTGIPNLDNKQLSKLLKRLADPCMSCGGHLWTYVESLTVNNADYLRYVCGKCKKANRCISLASVLRDAHAGKK